MSDRGIAQAHALAPLIAVAVPDLVWASDLQPGSGSRQENTQNGSQPSAAIAAVTLVCIAIVVAMIPAWLNRPDAALVFFVIVAAFRFGKGRKQVADLLLWLICGAAIALAPATAHRVVTVRSVIVDGQAFSPDAATILFRNCHPVPHVPGMITGVGCKADDASTIVLQTCFAFGLCCPS